MQSSSHRQNPTILQNGCLHANTELVALKPYLLRRLTTIGMSHWYTNHASWYFHLWFGSASLI